MTWYLVFGLMLGQYIGPMTKEDCEASRTMFKSAQCKESKYFITCILNNGASAYPCPDWSIK